MQAKSTMIRVVGNVQGIMTVDSRKNSVIDAGAAINELFLDGQIKQGVMVLTSFAHVLVASILFFSSRSSCIRPMANDTGTGCDELRTGRPFFPTLLYLPKSFFKSLFSADMGLSNITN